MGIMGLSEILDGAVDLLKKYIKTTILYSLAFDIIFMVIGCILIFVSVLFIGIGTAFVTIALKNSPISSKAKSTILITIIMVILVLFIALIVIAFTLCSNVGIIRISSQDFLKENIGISAALGESFKNIHKVFGLVFSIGILFLPTACIFCIPTYLLYSWFKGMNYSFSGGDAGKIILFVISTIILLLFFIAILLVYTTLFTFSLNAIIIEKKGIISALNRSYQLVKKDFWKIYGCNVLIGLTISALRYSLSSVVALVLGIIYLILKYLNAQQDFLMLFSMIYSYANWPISIISWLIINPLGIIMINLLYFNQRFKREGFDMIIRLKRIERINIM